MEEACRAERDAERMRRERFAARLPGLASFPGLGRVLVGFYGHGFPYIAALVLAIAVFTAVKLPYLGVPFTGPHSMKYNTYVEPAIYMERHGTMLWNQKRYVADPVHNPEGIFRKFDKLPLMEWGLYLTYRLFPDAGIEMKTRLFTHVIGILILLLAYRFFCAYFPKAFVALFLGLFAISPVFSFSTYITVLDSIVMVFMFVSLGQLTVFLERKQFANLWWAAIWFGLGNAVKYPLFLWLAPITFVMLFMNKEDTVSFLKYYTIFIFVTLLVTFSTILAVGRLISSPSMAAFFAVAAAAILIAIRFAVETHGRVIHQVFEGLLSRKLALALALCGAGVVGLLVLRFFRLTRYSNEFMTDMSLIGNYRLYKYMLFHQFKEYMTRNLFWFGMFGTALAFLMRERTVQRIVGAFVTGSLVYWIVASKAIFFHIYYSFIIVMTLTLGAAYAAYFIGGKLEALPQKVVAGLLLLALVLPPALDATEGRMKRYLNVDDAVEYIRQNTKPGEFLLFEGFLTPLSIYTGRGFVMPAVMIDETVREDVRRYGFGDTLRKFGVRYLITLDDPPFYMDYAPIFADTPLKEASGRNFDRAITIHKAIGSRDAELTQELRQAKEIEKKYDIPDKFVLADQVGRFRFYKFKN